MDHGNDNRVDQVLAIILLAYAIAWPGMFLADFIFPGNPIVEGLAGPFYLPGKHSTTNSL